MRAWICRLAVFAALAAPAYAAPPLDESNIDVSVQHRGTMIVVDVRMAVDATARETWDVLTDYEHMAAFVSNLKSSAILRRNGNTLEVEQIGEAKRGLLTFPFETVRLVELVPYSEIRSSLIKGKFKSYLFTTRIIDGGSKAIIVNHGEYEPTVWVPPMLGPAMIEAETRTQYAELRREVLRRKRVATATP
jgi:hypothetical protein